MSSTGEMSGLLKSNAQKRFTSVRAKVLFSFAVIQSASRDLGGPFYGMSSGFHGTFVEITAGSVSPR